MGQEVANLEVAEEVPGTERPARIKHVEHSYTRELLLSFADRENCKKRPQNLDPVVCRDAPAADNVEGGIAIPATPSRGLVRRDSRESEAFSKSPVDIPEWRKDSWRAGGSGALVPPGPRRKPYDEEPPGNAFSTSYPPRPAGNWDNGHRSLQGQGSGRWEHRAGLPDREREAGRPLQKWDDGETVATPVVPLEALRPEIPRPFGNTGSVVRPPWLPAAPDGLLGSGGGLHRTYTGNFTTPSALRNGPERQMSMGPPERQMSMGPLDRPMNMGPLERQMSVGPPERQMGMGPPERQMGMGLPERLMGMGPPERQMSMGQPERQMSMGPPERQMSMGQPERQNSFGRGISRNSETHHPSRPLKGPTFPRREDTDFVNDETFGSENSSIDDRTEQERKRREEFELMRKDQHRKLQKQQKSLSQKHEERLSNPESVASRKHDESALWDATTLSSDGISSSPPRSPEKSSPDSEATSGLVPTPAVAPSTPRPAIPPGFAKVVHQKQVTLKASSAQESPLEGHNGEAKDGLKETGLQSESGASQEKVVGDDSIKVPHKLLPKAQDSSDNPEHANSSAPMMPPEVVLSATPPEAHDEILKSKHSIARAGEEKQEWILPSKSVLGDKKDGTSGDEVKENNFVSVEEFNTTQDSLLHKLFGKPKLEKEPLQDEPLPTSTLSEEIKISKEDGWSEADAKMSKFAQWFPQEENQSKETASVPSDILSLFPNGGTSKAPLEHTQTVQEGPQKSNPVNVLRNPSRILPMPSGPSLEDIEKGLKENASSGHEQGVSKVPNLIGTLSLKNLDVEPRGDNLSGVFGEHSPVGRFNFRPIPPPRQPASRSSPVFLTCEDIEQSMLAEQGSTIEKSILNPAKPSGSRGSSRGRDGPAADSAASRHLLSLLKKGSTGGKHSPESSWSGHIEAIGSPGMSLSDRYKDGEDYDRTPVAQGPGGAGKKPSSDTPTLEALFGTAFMSELRSVEAPVSAHVNASDYFGSTNGPQPLSGVYPVSRQSTGRTSNASANTNVLNQWTGTVGVLPGWMDGNVLETNRHGSLRDVSGPTTQGVNQFVSPDKEGSRPVTSSGHGLWGNEVNSLISEGSLPMNPGVGNKGSFVSNAESTSFTLGDLTDNSVKGKGHLSRAHNSDLEMRTSSQVNGDGKFLPLGNFVTGQLSVSEDGSLPVSEGKVLSSDEPIIDQSAPFDSSGLPQVSKEDGLAHRLRGMTTATNFGMVELSEIEREENSVAVAQGIEGFLSASRKIGRKENLEDILAGDTIGLGDNGNSGNDKRMVDTLPDTLGFIGKAKDASARVSPISTAGFPEQGNANLARSNSNSIRFKGNVGAMQPNLQFNGFPVGPPLHHQQSIGALYRSDSGTSQLLQARQQPSTPVQHHLQQNPGSGMAMFPPQQFHPQPGLPQQQQLLARTFSNGSSMEYPHVPFGHASTSSPSRQVPAGHMHFPPISHGMLSPPGVYPPMGHMGGISNHFLPPAHIPQRGPLSPMGDGHMFMPEQSLHDPHVLGPKPGSQQGPSLFPLGGHALQSGQAPMFHQPIPHNLRGQQNQLVPGPAPWDMRSYPPELMRTSSKGPEMSGFVNGSGGGANSLDRWFGMELSRNVSGIPTPGLLQVSPHVLDGDSKVRFG